MPVRRPGLLGWQPQVFAPELATDHGGRGRRHPERGRSARSRPRVAGRGARHRRPLPPKPSVRSGSSEAISRICPSLPRNPSLSGRCCACSVARTSVSADQRSVTCGACGSERAELHRRQAGRRRGRPAQRPGRSEHGRGLRHGTRLQCGGRRRRLSRRGQRVRDVARHHAQRAAASVAAVRRRHGVARRGDHRRRVREHRQADRADPHRGDSPGAGPDPVLRRRCPRCSKAAARAST